MAQAASAARPGSSRPTLGSERIVGVELGCSAAGDGEEAARSSRGGGFGAPTAEEALIVSSSASRSSSPPPIITAGAAGLRGGDGGSATKSKKAKKAKEKAQRKREGKAKRKEKKKEKKASGKGKKKKKEKKKKNRGKQATALAKKARRASSTSSTTSSTDRSGGPADTPMEIAAQFARALDQGDLLLARHLVMCHGAAWRSPAGDCALHLAVRAGRTDLVAWLLSRPEKLPGASAVDPRNLRGETPLLLAARLFRGAAALHLVEALADPGATDASGTSPEAFDLDGLLREAEAEVRAARRAEEQRLLAVTRAARRAREEAEWRERVFFETGIEEGDPLSGYDDLERADALREGGDWMDDVRRQAEVRREAEARRLQEERLRAEIARQARARARAEAQEAAAREAARAADARFRAAASGAGERDGGSAGAAGGARGAASAGSPTAEAMFSDPEAREAARIAARAEDEARWSAFEARLAAEGPTGIRACEVPWPSGPPGNPLRVDPGGHPAVVRSQLRAGLLRWHPDKFEQRLAQLLPADGGEREAALARVKDIAQQLTRLLGELAVAVAGATAASGSAAA